MKMFLALLVCGTLTVSAQTFQPKKFDVTITIKMDTLMLSEIAQMEKALHRLFGKQIGEWKIEERRFIAFYTPQEWKRVYTLPGRIVIDTLGVR